MKYKKVQILHVLIHRVKGQRGAVGAGLAAPPAVRSTTSPNPDSRFLRSGGCRCLVIYIFIRARVCMFIIKKRRKKSRKAPNLGSRAGFEGAINAPFPAHLFFFLGFVASSRPLV